MALIRTWSIQTVNQVIDVSSLANMHQDTVLKFKRFITGAAPAIASGAWTIHSSSNGTVANTSDNWTTAADLVYNTEGNAHSWIVFKSPAGYVPGGNFAYLLVTLSAATTYSIQWFMSGALFTGGTITATPTSVSSSSTGSYQWQSNILPVGMSWHGTRNTFGDFVFLVSKNGAGYALTGFLSASLGEAQVGDGYPWYVVAPFVESGAGCFNQVQWASNYNARMTWTGGGSVPAGSYSPLMPRDFTDGNSWINAGGPTDQIDPTKVMAWPMHVGNFTPMAYRGKFVDIALGANSTPQLTGEPSGTIERRFVGCVWIPISDPNVPVF